MATSAYQWGNIRRASFQFERWSWSLRLWLMLAMILAVAFHWWLFYFFDNLEMGRNLMPQRQVERIRPDRVKISPELLKQQEAIRQIPDQITDGTLKDKPMKTSLEEIVDFLPKDQAMDLTPQVDKIMMNRPDAKSESALPAQSPSLAAIASSVPGPDIASAANSLKSSGLKRPLSANQLTLSSKTLDNQLSSIDDKILNKLNDQSVGSGANKTLPGFSNLDALIASGGGVSASTAPIAIPTDLLFEYGSDDLAEGARLSMMKLGYLIQKNPNSRFIIEGHTDNFGTAEYNLNLGQRRANAVVNYLMSALRLNADRIEAVGIGKARLLVPGTRSIEEQAPNRRVEIKVRTLR